MTKVFFLTDAIPFPPHDGRKVPVANYVWEWARRGVVADVLVAVKQPRAGGVLARANEFWARVRPFGPYFTTEALADADLSRLRAAGPAILFVAPGRLMGLALSARTINPALRIVLLLNDAQWGMNLEALHYGLGLYPGGKAYDLGKGLLLPSTLMREMTAYRDADVVVVQTSREAARLPWLGRRIVVAPNAVAQPAIAWNGQQSHEFAVQVNFTNRREAKLRPFIQNIWPKIRASEPTLGLALFGPGAALPGWAEGVAGVRYAGPVADLDAFLADKRAFLVPLEHGTGISNTVLRGLAMDMPMVITDSSSRGVRSVISPWPENRVRIARNATDFIRQTLAVHHGQSAGHPRQVGSWSENLDAILAGLDRASV